MEKKIYHVEGMYCSACQGLVLKTAKETKHVLDASVNLLTNILTVEIEDGFNEEDLLKNVKSVGYSIYKSTGYISDEIYIRKKQFYHESINLFCILIFFVLVTIFTMIKGAVEVVPFQIIALVGSITAMGLSYRVYLKGYKSLFKGYPGMETLISISTTICFIYGVYTALKAIISPSSGEAMNKFLLADIMIIFFVSIGKYVEGLSKNVILNKLNQFSSQLNIETLVKKDPGYVKTKIEDVKKDDILVINAGDYIPLDGVIIEGNGYIEETAINGEATPVFKNINDELKGGSLLQSGHILYKVTKQYRENDMGKISTLLQDNVTSKLSFNNVIDRITRWFIPGVLGISLIVLIIWLIVSKGNFELSLNYALSTLVVTCPCALGLAAPLCISIGTILGLKNNIIFKSGESIEKISKVNLFAFDKTKTLTEGYLRIVHHDCFSSDQELDNAIYSIEKQSSHPLAMAIEKFFLDKGCKEIPIEDINNILGKGIEGTYQKKKIFIGNFDLVKSKGYKGKEMDEKNEGSSHVYITYNNTLIYYFEMKDIIKEEAPYVIKKLEKNNKVILISGDNEKSTSLIANQVGIKEYFSNISAFNKEEILCAYKEDLNTYETYTSGRDIKDSACLNPNVNTCGCGEPNTNLSAAGECDARTQYKDISHACTHEETADEIEGNKRCAHMRINNKDLVYTCMIGDGINDALALNSSDLAISFGNASTIAISKSEIVLLDGNLNSIVSAQNLSKRIIQRIKINIGFSFIYNLCLIPLAAGAFSSLGVNLEPQWSALAMSLSSLSVVISSLLLFKTKK